MEEPGWPEAMNRTALLERALDSLPVEVWVMNAAGRYSLQNAASRERWGDLTGKSLEDVGAAPEQLRQWGENDERAFGGRTVNGTYSVETDQGARWFRDVLTPIRDDSEVRAVLGANIDITDYVSTRDRAEELRQRFAQLLDRSDVARADERRKLSEQIQSEVGRTLSTVHSTLDSLRKDLSPATPPTPKAFDLLHESHNLCGAMVDFVESLSVSSRPVSLGRTTLEAALQWEAMLFQNRSGIRVECALDGEPPLGPECRTAAYRIISECLTNVERHAGASRVRISSRREDGFLVLEVDDDGRGIREDEIVQTATIGLVGMRERARAHGGAVEVRGTAGQGTTVTLKFPTGD